MPDAEHHVVYKAFADFTALYAEVAKAKAAVRSLNDDTRTARPGTTASTAERGREIAQQRDLNQATREHAAAADNDARATERQRRSHQQLALFTRTLASELSAAERKRREAAQASGQYAQSLDRETAASRKRVEAEGQLALFSRRSVDLLRQARDARRAALRDLNNERDHFASLPVHVNTANRALSEHGRAHDQAGVATQRSIANSHSYVRAFRDQIAILRAKRSALGDHGRAHASVHSFTLRSIRLSQQFTQNIRTSVRDLNSLRRAASDSGGGGNGFFDLFSRAGDRASGMLTGFLSLFRRFLALLVIIAVVGGPVIAMLGALGGAAIGAGNALLSMSGVLAALPGLLLAVSTGVAALIVGMLPLVAAFKAYSDNQKQVAAGSRQVAEAHREAADRTRAAERAYRAALKGNADAQYDAKRSQVELNEARRDALRDLQDLRAELERSALNEQGAILALQEAEDQYRRTLADPDATLLDRQQALLRIKDAEADLGEVRRRNQRLAEDAALAEQRGVEGSERVVDAKRRAEDAQFSLVQASERLRDATVDLAKAQREQAAGGAQALKTQNALQDELAKLSPSTRTVALGVLAMGDAWKALQRNVSERLFAPIVGQLTNLKGLLPVIETLLGESAGALGDVIAKGIAMVSSGPWRADFAILAKNNADLIRNFGDAGWYLASALKDIAVAAGPFTTWVSEAIKGIAADFAKWSETARGNGSIARFLDDTRERLRSIWRIMGNLAGTVSSLYIASKEFTTWMLNGLERMTAGWRATTKEQEAGGSGFRKWLQDIKPLLSSIKTFLGDVARAFAALAADPHNIKEAQRILGILSDKILPKVVVLFTKISEYGAVGDILEAVATGLDALNTFLERTNNMPLRVIVWFLEQVAAWWKFLLDNPTIGSIIAGIAVAIAAFTGAAAFYKLSGLRYLFSFFSYLFARGGGILAFFRTLPTLIGDLVTRLGGMAGVLRSLPSLLTRLPALLAALGPALVLLGAKFMAGMRGGATAAAGAAGAAAAAAGGAGGGATYTAQLSTIITLLRGIQACVCRTAALAGAGAGAAAAGGGAAALGGRAAATGGRAAIVRGLAVLAGIAGVGAAGAAAGGAGGGGPVLNATQQRTWWQRLLGRPASPNAPWIVPGTGSAARAGGGLAARGATRFLGGPLSWLGLGVGLAGEYAFDNRRSAGAQLTRGSGAVLTGAGIGAGIGALFGGIGAGPGAAIGAAAGGAYSLAKDPGLRKTVGDFFAGIGRWFVTVGKSIGRWGKTHIVDPVVDFFDRLTQPIRAFGRRVGKWAYDTVIAPITHIGERIWEDIIRPLLAIFIGVQTWLVDMYVQAQQWIFTYVYKPIFDLLVGVGRWIGGGIAAVGGWIADHFYKPVFDFFAGIGKWVWDLYAGSRKWVYENLEKPVYDFFANIGRGMADAYNAGRKWANEHVSQPVLRFFKAIGAFLWAIPKALEKWAEKLPFGIGDRIKKAMGDLGGGEERKQSGGVVGGTFDGRVDTRSALLTPGEFVTRKRVVDKPGGKDLLRDLNDERVDPAAVYAALNIAAASVNLPAVAPARVRAASTVVNNTTTNDNTRNAGMSIGDVTINNPIRERSERSLRRSLHTLAYMSNR